MLFYLLPMRQGLRKLIPVHFDPLAFEVDHPVLRLEQLFEFRFGQPFLSQGDMDIEVKHGIKAERALTLFADQYGNPYPTAGAPPVREPDQQTALFIGWNFQKKGICLLCRPCQRMKEVSRFNQIIH